MKKGNLLCFKREIERVQRIHKEKMTNIAAATNAKRTPACYRKAHPSKSLKEQRLEIDVRRHNAFLVGRMAQIHELGGCQRRALREFQDVKAALTFGKANAAVARVIREARLTARKKEHERIRKANANMITRLAVPLRSDIDFNKFESDFIKSRAHCRMAHCDRTVGHTSAFEAPLIRALHSRADASFGETSHHERPSDEMTRGTRPTACHTAAQRRPEFTRYLKSRQRPRSADFISSRGNGYRSQVLGGNPTNLGNDSGRNKALTPRRPQIGTTKESHPHRLVYRPRTASRSRRRSDHHHLFDARAADTGWGSGVLRNIARPPSVPERIEWERWRTHKSTERSQGHLDQGTPSERDGADHEQQEWIAETKAKHGLHYGSKCGQDNFPYLGRTLLAEATVAVSCGSKGRNDRHRREVVLQCLSLDGLLRQHQQVHKTLRGFVVEASLTPRRKPFRPHVMDGRGKDCPISSAYLTVIALQKFLCTTGIEGSSDLALLRGAHDLDGQGNYPDLRTLLSKRGQRDLCKILLGSSQVLMREGTINVRILNTNVDGGLGLSAVIATPDITAQRRPPPCQQSPKVVKEQRLLVAERESGTEGEVEARMGAALKHSVADAVISDIRARSSVPMAVHEPNMSIQIPEDALGKTDGVDPSSEDYEQEDDEEAPETDDQDSSKDHADGHR